MQFRSPECRIVICYSITISFFLGFLHQFIQPVNRYHTLFSFLIKSLFKNETRMYIHEKSYTTLNLILQQGHFFGFILCADRKSTRLNSSHVAISYAVFCLKKKNQQTIS